MMVWFFRLTAESGAEGISPTIKSYRRISYPDNLVIRIFCFYKKTVGRMRGLPDREGRYVLLPSGGWRKQVECVNTELCEKVRETALQSGMWQADCIGTEKLVFYPEIRKICQENTCRNYGTSWACPPAVGTLEECRKRIRRYGRMLVFSKKYELEDSFDFKAMARGMSDFKDAVDTFHEKLRPILKEFLLLANEGCGRCARCTYPDAPCRFPELLHPSLEGYGFQVGELAKLAGIQYNNGPRTVTYFGGLFFKSQEEL